MADEKRKETDEELMERFDAFVRSTLLEEGNKLREEKGYPPLSETDLEDVDTLSALKETFGKKDRLSIKYSAARKWFLSLPGGVFALWR